MACNFHSASNQWCPDCLASDAPTNPALVEAARELEIAEQNYRHKHDLCGAGARETGRAWDRMRKAGDRLRAVLDKEVEHGLADGTVNITLLIARSPRSGKEDTSKE